MISAVIRFKDTTPPLSVTWDLDFTSDNRNITQCLLWEARRTFGKTLPRVASIEVEEATIFDNSNGLYDQAIRQVAAEWPNVTREEYVRRCKWDHVMMWPTNVCDGIRTRYQSRIVREKAQHELAELQTLYDRVQQELADCKTQRANWAIDELTAECKKLSGEAAKLITRCDAYDVMVFNPGNEELCNEITRLQKSNGSLYDKNVGLREELSSLRMKLETAKSTINMKDELITCRTDEIKQLNDRVVIQYNAREKAECKLREANKTLEAVRMQRDAAESSLKLSAQTANRLSVENEQLASRIVATGDEVRSLTAEAAKLRKENATLHEEAAEDRANSRAANTELREECFELRERNADMQKKLEMNRATAKTHDAARVNLEAAPSNTPAVDRLVAANDELYKTVAVEASEIVRLESLNATLGKQLMDVCKENTSLRESKEAAVSGIRSECTKRIQEIGEAAQDNIDELKEQLAEAKRVSEDMAHEIGAFRLVQNAGKFDAYFLQKFHQLDEAEAEINRAGDNISKIRIAQLTEHLTARRKELESIKADYDRDLQKAVILRSITKKIPTRWPDFAALEHLII